MEDPGLEITSLLNRAASGDQDAAAKVFPRIYQELKKLASAKRAQLPHGETLATTALVHEAYLRVAERNPDGWAGARHFYFTAVRAMRDILVEEARRRSSRKRGGGAEEIPIDEIPLDEISWMFDSTPEEVLALDAALSKLEGEDPEGHQLLVLHYYGGLTFAEIADLLDTPLRTIERRCRFLRAWLARELEVS